jgi:uncharacterized protein YcbK (DUF882 family)
MSIERRRPQLATGLALAGAFWASLQTAAVHADRQHTVRPGQSLALIAKQYNINISALAAANGIEKGETLHGGQVLKVPPEGVVYVASGQTLGSIARDHHVATSALAKANHLKLTATLQIGQRLVLPGFKASARATTHEVTHEQVSAAHATARESAGSKRWGKPAHRGVVRLYRIWSNESQTLRLVDSKGRARSAAQRAMREFLRPRESRRRKTPNARLLGLLAQVSDHFGGRVIHVVSGYRLPGGYTRDTSRHVAGEAIDFRIPGVPLTELRDYCSHFPNVGVGYYPRTQFIHLDVRRQAGRWTDWSLAGQAPLLTKPAELDDPHNDGAGAPLPQSEAEIPEPPPAPDDGQPPLEITSAPPPEPSPAPKLATPSLTQRRYEHREIER